MMGAADTSLREAFWILVIWGFFAIWVLGSAALFAYPDDPASMTLTLGFPTWVVWGIAFPWIVATLVTIWFCLCVMQDHESVSHE